jgi:hypothetical protein
MKRKILIIAVIAATGLAGCKKYLNEVANPNVPPTTTPSFALSGAEKIVADIPNGIAIYEGGSYTQYGYWDGNWAVSSGFIVQPPLSQYNFTTSEFQVWTDLYLNIQNLKTLEGVATTAGDLDYVSIAQILEAYDWEQLVDNYNDVPYTAAFNTKNLFPAYDKAATVYADVITSLDVAIAAIQKNGSATAPSSDDIIFGGNMTGWLKFANTIKLRMIMRQSNLSTFAALKAELNSTASVGYLDGTTDAEANPGYSLSDAYGGQESPFWHAYGTTAVGNPEDVLVKAGNFEVNILHGFNDPRITQFYATVSEPAPGQGESAGTIPAGTLVVRGLNLGDVALSADTNGAGYISGVGPGLLKSAAMNAVIFSGAESLFLQAEAVNDGMLTAGTGVTAESLYEAAITASFETTGAFYTNRTIIGAGTPKPDTVYTKLTPDASAVQYYSQPIINVNWTKSIANTGVGHGGVEEAIITQKFLALNGYAALEQYNELRRTGFPFGVPISQDPSRISNTLPTRIYYPQVEYDTNTANANAEGSINPFTSKIFWAK